MSLEKRTQHPTHNTQNATRKKEIKKVILFAIVTKKSKINLTKEVKDLYKKK